jgi:hypothetical protein
VCGPYVALFVPYASLVSAPPCLGTFCPHFKHEGNLKFQLTYFLLHVGTIAGLRQVDMGSSATIFLEFLLAGSEEQAAAPSNPANPADAQAVDEEVISPKKGARNVEIVVDRALEETGKIQEDYTKLDSFCSPTPNVTSVPPMQSSQLGKNPLKRNLECCQPICG